MSGMNTRGVGLCGSHRTGKTTLARALAREGFPLVETRTSAVFERLGFNPALDYPMSTRVMIQEAVLADACDLYEAQRGSFVADRTPLDMLVYTLADCQRANLGPEEQERVLRYRADCVDVLNRHFSDLIVISPGVPLKDEPGKAGINLAFIEHFHLLLVGVLNQPWVTCRVHWLPQEHLSLAERRRWIESTGVLETWREAI